MGVFTLADGARHPGGLGLRLQQVPAVRGTCRFFWGHHMWAHTWQAWVKATVLNFQPHPRMTEFSILLYPNTLPKPWAFWKFLFSLSSHIHTVLYSQDLCCFQQTCWYSLAMWPRLVLNS